MWKRSGSFWASSLLFLGLLLPGCSVDDELLYNPAEPPLTIQPPHAAEYDQAPAVSDNAATLAWVRIGPDGLGGPTVARLLRLRRATSMLDTLFTCPEAIEAIDISPDGERVVGLVSGDTDSAALILWRNGGIEPLRPFPPDYTEARTPRWDGETSVLFGGSGPEGSGVYRWELTTDRVSALAVRFPDASEEWSGEYPGIDRSGNRICLERRTERYTFQAMVRTLDVEDEVVYAVAGGSPHFWQLLPDEPDGLFYVDRTANLWAVRLATGDTYPILGQVYDYDVSPDGKWLFARASIPFLGPALTLRDLRDLR